MYRYIVLRWRQTHNHDCFLQVIHTCITLLQYTLENNFSLIVKQSQAVNCLCKSRYILPQKLLPGKKKKISYFLCFPEYILPFLVINISTDICCSCLLQTYRKQSFKHANYFNVSSNCNNEQIFAEHLPKVIVSSFHHNVRMF